jgi:hypothetical protein
MYNSPMQSSTSCSFIILVTIIAITSSNTPMCVFVVVTSHWGAVVILPHMSSFFGVSVNVWVLPCRLLFCCKYLLLQSCRRYFLGWNNFLALTANVCQWNSWCGKDPVDIEIVIFVARRLCTFWNKTVTFNSRKSSRSKLEQLTLLILNAWV